MRIARHTLFNLIGLGAPLLLAVVTIPALLEGLGAGRFGLLTLIWAAISYFGLFDLGLGRALTLQLAVALDRKEDARVGPLCATALLVMLVAGVLGALVLAGLAPWALGFISGLPDDAQALASLRMMALALPFIVLTAGLRGMLEACHAFGAINAIRLPMGVWTFGGPWLVLLVCGPDLAVITAVLVVGRVLACVAHGAMAWRALPQLRGRLAWRSSALGPLVRAGGWLTLSNLVGPLMGYADRFILGSVLSAAAVAYYATPQELVMKLWILPGALTAVLFPTLAAKLAEGDAAAAALCREALHGLILVTLPITLGLAVFAQPLLVGWLGRDFAAQASGCLEIFALGMFFTGLAQLPFTALQSAGRASTTAAAHLLELPLFIAGLVWAAGRYGIEGAAWVWLLRVLVDTGVMFFCARRVSNGGHGVLFDAGSMLSMVAAGMTFLGLALPSFALRAAWWLAVCVVAASVAMRQWRLRR